MRIADLLGASLILASCATPPPEPANSLASTPSPSVMTASPTPTPDETDLTDELVAVVTDDLVVRSRPGTGPDSDIYDGRLNTGAIVYVIAGPEAANGYDWYLVDPLVRPCLLGCETADPRSGWVAAAGKDGERWLAAQPVRDYPCPQPTVEDLRGSYPQLGLYCFKDRELVLDGVVGTEVVQTPAAWAWDQRVALWGPGYAGSVTGCIDACPTPLWIALDTDAALPPPMRSVTVTGHFHDAKAGQCQSTDVDQRLVTHQCQMVFVVSSWE